MDPSLGYGLSPGAIQCRDIVGHQDQYQNDKAFPHGDSQVSDKSQIHCLLERVLKLEHGQNFLHRDIYHLREDYSSLSQLVDSWKNGSVSPSSTEFRQKLDKLKLETMEATSGADTALKGAANGTSDAGNKSLPPHLRVKTDNGTTSHPLHPRTDNIENGLITDGPVDNSSSVIYARPVSPVSRDREIGHAFMMRPAPQHTPPSSSLAPTTTYAMHPDEPRQSVEEPYVVRSGQGWMPLAIRSFPLLPVDQLCEIPAAKNTISFSYDFLNNTFGGILWSPGLKYIPPSPGYCILPNRSYYLLEADFEPYLPKAPGQHGAKLTAFFNQNPEDVYRDDAGCSFEDVPMFVSASAFGPQSDKEKKRYIYFGNYSQTRWSDKLDYDRMVDDVPAKVKEYWAVELSAIGRAEWVSDALMKHFFPKPEYEGRLFGGQVEGSVALEEEAELEERVVKDVKHYTRELKEWEVDARLKTKLIKKEFILQAFERVCQTPPR